MIRSDPESVRLRQADQGLEPWRRWGPYLSERAWCTVREDYSADGETWTYLTHDQARSRAYRWSEDGLGGICDDQQRLCLAFAFWNGRDPILKERIFGLTGTEGNHGEDAKEYWWYLDSTPTHSWMSWRYAYPQAEFPYDRLVETNRARTREDPEFELLDTGVFAEDRYWDIRADYAKAGPEEYLVRLEVTNRGPEAAELDVLPTLWFRNSWSWRPDGERGRIALSEGLLVAEGRGLSMRLAGEAGGEALFCENDTNTLRLDGVPGPAYPKDGINDHVVNGAPTVNPAQTGSKAALHYRLRVGGGESAVLRLRLGPAVSGLGDDFDDVMALRRAEADAFYRLSTPGTASPAEAEVLRQALAGMLWSKQFYHYNVADWLAGDPAQPAPPATRLTGRNAAWSTLDARDVISMPDPWEYPWFASWDLAFHCVALAYVDPTFAKEQLLLLCREWYMHPNGQLPAYEWSFSDVNPPVHAWAALTVFDIDGARDFQFLKRIHHKLLLNFTWWVNRKDAAGMNVFEGGFLGLDNIGAFDRSRGIQGATVEQSDATAWMAMYCLDLLQMSLVLAGHDESYQDIAVKFFEHFTFIARAINEKGLWDEADGFYYDVILPPDGQPMPLRARSMVGLIPLFAVTVIEPEMVRELEDFSARMEWFIENRPDLARVVEHIDRPGMEGRLLLSIADGDRVRRMLSYALAEDEFLSPHGLRSVSQYHARQPFEFDFYGLNGTVDYEPAESRSGLFGGNSNWRGPVWFPVNFLLIRSLRRFYRYFGDQLTVPLPAGSGQDANLLQVSEELSRRLVSIFLPGADGRRPLFGSYGPLPAGWEDRLFFHEYFHGDTGAGLGASHQTGWTGLVAALIGGGLSGTVPAAGGADQDALDTASPALTQGTEEAR